MKNISIVLLIISLVSCHNNTAVKDPLALRERLEGRWKADAFSGRLHER